MPSCLEEITHDWATATDTAGAHGVVFMESIKIFFHGSRSTGIRFVDSHTIKWFNLRVHAALPSKNHRTQASMGTEGPHPETAGHA